MSNPRSRNKSIALEGSPQVRVYQSFEEWQAERLLDTRTPEERGIRAGSVVMWRHRTDAQVIVTERAVVQSVEGNTLTLLVKDVEDRTCTADIHEIVDNSANTGAASGASRSTFRSDLANRRDARSSASATPANPEDSLGAGARL